VRVWVAVADAEPVGVVRLSVTRDGCFCRMGWDAVARSRAREARRGTRREARAVSVPARGET
jgi:hypothetical protein